MTEVIYRYTRAETIEDGVLIDVPPLGKAVNYRVPVALTAGALSEVGKLEGIDQVARGVVRTLEVLEDAKLAFMRAGAPEGDRVAFKGAGGDLVVVPSGGDQGEPVLTIMLPNEV